MIQPIEFPEMYLGKVVTLSVWTPAGIFTSTGRIPDSFPSSGTAFFNIRLDHIFIFRIILGPNSLQVRFSSGNVGSIDIIATKLELGPVSTLANDPPPDFGTELLKCQRFYETSYPYGVVAGHVTPLGLTYGTAFDTAHMTGAEFKVTKRIFPRVVLYGRNGTRNRITLPMEVVADWPNAANATNVSTRGMLVASSGLTVGEIYRFHWVADANL